ncbi:MAG: creatininase family protein [Bacteroidota bacterium]
MLFAKSSAKTINSQVTNKVVLFPLGAIEQHGPHLSVSTDTDLVSNVAAGAESKLPDDILLCPTLPFGSSHHHLSMGGTISIAADTYSQVIVQMVESLLQNGFRRIVLLNGHGGNITPVRQALSLLSHTYDASMHPNIVLATYWELAAKYFTGAAPMESPALSHACEYETSLMLHLCPEKVFPDEIKRAARPLSNGYIPWEDDEPYSGVSIVKKTQFISNNGSSGEPQLGSAEKGSYLYSHAVEELVTFIGSFKTWPFLEDLSKRK